MQEVISRILGYCKRIVPAFIPRLVARKESPPAGPPGGPPTAKREMLLRIIRKKPGIRVVDLMKVADVGFGSIYHHLRRLEAEGLIFSVKEEGGARKVYPVGAAVPESESRRMPRRVPGGCEPGRSPGQGPSDHASEPQERSSEQEVPSGAGRRWRNKAPPGFVPVPEREMWRCDPPAVRAWRRAG